jgi:hypothetical protein
MLDLALPENGGVQERVSRTPENDGRRNREHDVRLVATNAAFSTVITKLTG